MAELNVKQKKFVDEYLKHGVGSKAVIAAGYSPNGASVTANHYQSLRGFEGF
jgi:phage terminase small subunit